MIIFRNRLLGQPPPLPRKRLHYPDIPTTDNLRGSIRILSLGSRIRKINTIYGTILQRATQCKQTIVPERYSFPVASVSVADDSPRPAISATIARSSAMGNSRDVQTVSITKHLVHTQLAAENGSPRRNSPAKRQRLTRFGSCKHRCNNYRTN